MPSLRHCAALIFLVCVSVALSQPLVETEGTPIVADEDGVEELVREMREARTRRGPEYRSISVYSTHYMIGPQRFDSLNDVLEYIKDFPPDQFNTVILGECSARAQMEELLEHKEEIDRPRRPRGDGFRRIGRGAPPECPWF